MMSILSGLGVSVRGLCPGPHPDRDPPLRYGKEWVVLILLECILVLIDGDGETHQVKKFASAMLLWRDVDKNSTRCIKANRFAVNPIFHFNFVSDSSHMFDKK